MIGEFLGRGDYPAVGISFGLERIFDGKKVTLEEETLPLEKENKELLTKYLLLRQIQETKW